MNSPSSNICPVCDGTSALFDVVDFNKNCEEPRGLHLDLSGEAIYYIRCSSCHFVFSPDMYSWDSKKFSEKVYNDEYIKIDPDFIKIRPQFNALKMKQMFSGGAKLIRHLDYGGGNGTFSQLLTDAGFNSRSVDPYAKTNHPISSGEKFNLITAFEVFEHIPYPRTLMHSLNDLLEPNGMICFSTLISDGKIQANQRLSWWYASPRNGHISLFSKRSLSILAKEFGFKFASFDQNLHLFHRGPPEWAKHLFKQN